MQQLPIPDRSKFRWQVVGYSIRRLAVARKLETFANEYRFTRYIFDASAVRKVRLKANKVPLRYGTVNGEE